MTSHNLLYIFEVESGAYAGKDDVGYSSICQSCEVFNILVPDVQGSKASQRLSLTDKGVILQTGNMEEYIL